MAILKLHGKLPCTGIVGRKHQDAYQYRLFPCAGKGAAASATETENCTADEYILCFVAASTSVDKSRVTLLRLPSASRLCVGSTCEASLSEMNRVGSRENVCKTNVHYESGYDFFLAQCFDGTLNGEGINFGTVDEICKADPRHGDNALMRLLPSI